jgi:MFS family permease
MRHSQNWSKLKKESTFASLIFAVALICPAKTMFVTVNAVIATELNVTYPAAAALTGVPYIFGALAALKGHVLSRFWGKRGLYLISATTVLVSMVWNMHIISSYPTFMISRILQGLGWGTFEALMTGSISDMFFVCNLNLSKFSQS